MSLAAIFYNIYTKSVLWDMQYDIFIIRANKQTFRGFNQEEVDAVEEFLAVEYLGRWTYGWRPT